MTDISYNPIFPVVVGMAINPNRSESEISQILSMNYEDLSDQGFPHTTRVRNILNELPEIKSFIDEALEDYRKKVLGSRSGLRITTSWATKHINTTQFQYRHAHPNSIVSGTYYVKTALDSEPITFFNPSPAQYFVHWDQDKELTDRNPFTSATIKFPCLDGLLLLYPSWIQHGVDGPPSSNVRCAISFNTVIDNGNP